MSEAIKRYLRRAEVALGSCDRTRRFRAPFSSGSYARFSRWRIPPGEHGRRQIRRQPGNRYQKTRRMQRKRENEGRSCHGRYWTLLDPYKGEARTAQISPRDDPRLTRPDTSFSALQIVSSRLQRQLSKLLRSTGGIFRFFRLEFRVSVSKI